MLTKRFAEFFANKKTNVRRAAAALLALGFFAFLYWLNGVQKPELVTTVGRSFERARVVEVVKDNIQEDGRRYGEQKVRLLMLSGPKKGQTVDATSAAGYLFGAGCTPGMKVVAVQSVSGDITVTAVYSADRETAIYVFVLLFFVILCAVAGRQGIKSSAGLLFTLACIFWLYLPLVFRGFSPFWAAVLVACVTTVVTMVLVGGLTKKAACAIIGTVSGVVIAGAAATCFGYFAGISGYNVSDIENLLFLADSTKIRVGGLLFSGLLISSLGAAMDIAITIASTVNEIHKSNPSLGRAALFSSGMRVGRDLMGSNSTTLILAFAGGSLSMLVSNYVYDLPYIQIINSYGIGIEIMQAFSAGFGILLAVPIVAAVSAVWMSSGGPAPAAEAPSAGGLFVPPVPAAAGDVPTEGPAPFVLFRTKFAPAAERLKRRLIRHWKLAAALVCLCVLAVCALRLYSIYSGYRSAGREYERAARTAAVSSAGSPAPGAGAAAEKPFSFDYRKLAAQNGDAVGWVRLPGTALSYPVVQGKDNVYYLDHTFYKSANRAGAVFLDSRIRNGFAADHSILYGHNMRDGSMFAALCRFRDKRYYEAHPSLELYTKNGETDCEIFSAHEAAPDGDTYTWSFPDRNAYGRYLEKMTRLSLYGTGVKATASNRVLTLSTCVDDSRDMRFVVHAKLDRNV